jgi:hypothetical protein
MAKIRPPSESLEHDPDREAAQEEASLGSAQVADLRQSTELRREYADKAHRIVCRWLLGVGGLLVIDAIHKPFSCQEIAGRSSWFCKLPSFDVETEVMISLIGGTTIAIIGLVLAVIKGLFPSSS